MQSKLTNATAIVALVIGVVAPAQLGISNIRANHRIADLEKRVEPAIALPTKTDTVVTYRWVGATSAKLNAALQDTIQRLRAENQQLRQVRDSVARTPQPVRNFSDTGQKAVATPTVMKEPPKSYRVVSDLAWNNATIKFLDARGTAVMASKPAMGGWSYAADGLVIDGEMMWTSRPTSQIYNCSDFQGFTLTVPPVKEASKKR